MELRYAGASSMPNLLKNWSNGFRKSSLISTFSPLSSSDEEDSATYLTGTVLDDDGSGFPEYRYAKPFGCTMFSIEKDDRLTPPSSSSSEDSEE
jgi:hypothetical protein